MKKLLTKALALIGLLMIGGSSAWADNFSSTDQDSPITVKMTQLDPSITSEAKGVVTNATIGGSSWDGTNFSAFYIGSGNYDSGKVAVVSIDASKVTGNISTASITFNITSGTSRPHQFLAVYTTNELDVTNLLWGNQGSSFTACTNVTCSGDASEFDAENYPARVSITQDKTENVAWDISDILKNNKKITVVLIAFRYKNQNVGGSNCVGTSTVNSNPVVNITTTTASFADYTINYKFEENTIKSVNGNDEVGATVNAQSPITIEGQKYYATSSIDVVLDADAANNVLDVTLRKANSYNWTVTSSLGTPIAYGVGVEDETVSYAYNKYILSGTDLYVATKQGSNPWWGKSILLDSDNKADQITYANPIANVVYYSEAEDIEGASSTSGSNTDIRCSGKAGGYGSNVNVCTLTTPGVYRLYTSIWGNSGKTITFNAGTTQIGSVATTGNITDYNTATFTVTENTDITFNGGDSSHPVDYIYIVRIGDVPREGDITSIVANPNIDGNTAGWTCEKPNGGNGPLKDNAVMEYWAGKNNITTAERDAMSFDYHQEFKGLPNGYYTVSAEMYNSLNGEVGAEFNQSCGVYGNNVIAYVTEESATLKRYTTDPILVTDGTLRIGVKSDKRMGARWFVADNFQLTYVGNTVSVTVPTSKWGSLCSDYALDFTGLDDIEAYIVTDETATSVTVEKVNKVPAKEGIFVHGITSNVPLLSGDADDMSANKLIGTTAPYTVKENVWALSAGELHPITEGTQIAKGKAYLVSTILGSSNAARRIIIKNNEATAIKNVEATANNAVHYNLAGQRVNANAKGIIVVNGKKVLK